MPAGIPRSGMLSGHLFPGSPWVGGSGEGILAHTRADGAPPSACPFCAHPLPAPTLADSSPKPPPLGPVVTGKEGGDFRAPHLGLGHILLGQGGGQRDGSLDLIQKGLP